MIPDFPIIVTVFGPAFGRMVLLVNVFSLRRWPAYIISNPPRGNYKLAASPAEMPTLRDLEEEEKGESCLSM